MYYLSFLDKECFEYHSNQVRFDNNEKNKIKKILSCIDINKLTPKDYFLLLNTKNYLNNFEKIWFMKKKSTLSVVYILKDEENYIESSIMSIIDVADEIIIVDTGSTDNTVNILENIKSNNSKIKIYHEKWIDNFAEIRNIANEYATSDWVLTLDGDEQFSSNKYLFKKLLNYIYKIEPLKNIIFNLNIINNNKIFTAGRLKKNNPNLKYVGKVHETYLLNNTSPLFINLDFDIISIDRMTPEKKDYYNDLLKQTIKDYPNFSRWIFIYLRDNFNNINFVDFECLVNKALKIDTKKSFSKENIKFTSYTIDLLSLLLYKKIACNKKDDFGELLNFSNRMFPDNANLSFLEYSNEIINMIENNTRLLNNYLDFYESLDNGNIIFDKKYLDSMLAKLLLHNGYITEALTVINDLYDIDPDLYIFKENLIQYLINESED